MSSLIPKSFFELPFRSLVRFPSFIENLERELPSLESSTGLTVSSDKENVYVEAHLPGIDSDAIDISIDNGILWIKGEKKEEKEDKDKTFYRKSQSNFSYRVSLPEQVDEKKASAEVSEGVLKITFPKTQKGKAQKIDVKKKGKK